MTWFTLSVEGWMREWMVAGPRDHKAEGCPVQTPSTRGESSLCVCGLGGKPTAHHNLHRHPRDHMLSSRALASTIAGGVGFGMGLAAAHLTQSSRSGSSSLCGGFRLVSGDKTQVCALSLMGLLCVRLAQAMAVLRATAGVGCYTMPRRALLPRTHPMTETSSSIVSQQRAMPNW